ncbi:hypothetical protein [Stutzerimonas kunmingensis]|uniref:hypothetical protein n=1 Tax=Stutzerimonas kunmingensis TaxID=1211807 RepID=UPI0028ADD0FA|nr:hypothetical protein [Stutzerimonas kunmingensis]
MARRQPRTFQAWLLGLAGTILTCVAIYYARVYAIERIAQGQLARTEAVMQQLKQQHADRTAAAEASKQAALRQKQQQDTYDALVMKAHAESEKRRQEAWTAFFVPKRGCDVWHSDSEMVECVNHEIRAKRDFDQKWAAGDFDKSQDL